MQLRKSLKISVPDFECRFNGTMSNISPYQNPYIEKAIELAKKNNIPETFLEYTKILHLNNELVFEFIWIIETESAESDKKEILAYIGELPKENQKNIYVPIFISIRGNIYKDYLCDYEEFKYDYKVSENTKKIDKNDELEYIDSLNIPWEDRYLKALIDLSNKYCGEEISEDVVREALTKDYFKKFILTECSKSLSDTATREVLCDWLKELAFEN